MQYNYQTQQLLDQGVNFATIYPEKQGVVKEMTGFDFDLANIVTFLKKETDNFTIVLPLALEIDKNIVSIYNKYQVSKGKSEEVPVPTPSTEAEPIPAKPTAAVLATRLKLVKKMYEKTPSVVLKDRIKIIEKMLTQPEKFCCGGPVGSIQEQILETEQKIRYAKEFHPEKVGILEDRLAELKGQKMSEGGIPNNYLFKSLKEVWDFWNGGQRLHFLMDHNERKQYTPASLESLSKKTYIFLPEYYKNELKKHVDMGQYDEGGSTKEYALAKYGVLKPVLFNHDVQFDPPYEVYQNANKLWAKSSEEQRENALQKYVKEFVNFSEMKKHGQGTAVPKMSWRQLAIGWQRDIAAGLHNDQVDGKEIPLGTKRMDEGGSLEEHDFEAIFAGKKIQLKGSSLYNAVLKAREQLHVPKSKQGLLSVYSVQSMDQGDYRFMAAGGEVKTELKTLNEELSKAERGTPERMAILGKINMLMHKHPELRTSFSGGGKATKFEFTYLIPDGDGMQEFTDNIIAKNQTEAEEEFRKKHNNPKLEIHMISDTSVSNDFDDYFDIIDEPTVEMIKNERSEVYALDMRDGSDFLITSERDIQKLIDSGDYLFGTEKMSGGGAVEPLKYKKGDIVYVYQYHSFNPEQMSKEEQKEYREVPKKYIVGTGNTTQKWSKVKILEPISNELGWARYKVKQIDGYHKDPSFVAGQSQMSTTNTGPIEIGYMSEGGPLPKKVCSLKNRK